MFFIVLLNICKNFCRTILITLEFMLDFSIYFCKAIYLRNLGVVFLLINAATG